MCETDDVILGSVTSGLKPQVNETAFDIQAVGQVASDIKISFLTLTIRKPTMNAQGLYTCLADVTRIWGGKERSSSTVHVTIKKLDNLSSYLGEQLLKLENVLKQQNTQLQILQEEVDKFKSGQMRVETGTYSVGNNIRKFPTNLGGSQTAEDVKVTFTSSFGQTPTVIQEVVYWDIDNDQDLKMRIEKLNVSRFGFVGRVRRWGGTIIYQLNIQWTAFL
ncbi:hypothetical protein Btru_073814 [Bulinus truncatus]|nr:hypothetical protein Btru_073814 [Bulinus truncatus]